MNLIERFLVETLSSIEILVKNNHYTQALILLYSAIDTMAWLEREEGDVTRNDFQNWANRYMLRNTNNPVSAQDLYAARCGLIHTHTAESKMSRSGGARQIWYYTGSNSKQHVQEVLESHSNFNQSNIIAVRFADLVDIFANGAMDFMADIRADEKRTQVVKNRIQKWLYWHSFQS